jgi:hypothetical protein
MTVATLSGLSTCLKVTLKELIHLLLDLLAEGQDHQLVEVDGGQDRLNQGKGVSQLTLAIRQSHPSLSDRPRIGGPFKVRDREGASWHPITTAASRGSPYEHPIGDTEHFVKLVCSPYTWPKKGESRELQAAPQGPRAQGPKPTATTDTGYGLLSSAPVRASLPRLRCRARGWCW